MPARAKSDRGENPMATTRKTETAAADAADEAQQPVEPAASADDNRRKTTLEMIQNAVEVGRAKVNAEYRPDIRDIKERLDNLEALETSRTDEGDDGLVTL